MKARSDTEQGLSAVPLLNAAYCAECETVSNSPHDACGVCGSHSVVNLFRLLGGTLRSAQPAAKTAKYNLSLTAEVRGVLADELNDAIRFVTRLAEAGGDVKCLHLDVEAVFNTEAAFRAA